MDNKKLLAAKELRDKRIAKLESLKSNSNLADIHIFIANILIGVEFKLNTYNIVSVGAEAAASKLSSEEAEAIAKILKHPLQWNNKPCKSKV